MIAARTTVSHQTARVTMAIMVYSNLPVCILGVQTCNASYLIGALLIQDQFYNGKYILCTIYFLYISISQSITRGHQGRSSMQESGSRNWCRGHGGILNKEYLLTHGLLRLPYYASQNHLTKDGTIHSDLDSVTLITNP